jgi:PhnB protein
MKLHTYLNFPGTCAEAFRFYEQNLGARITTLMTHAELPPDSPRNPGMPPDWDRAVLHARLELGETALLGADIPEAQPMRSAYLTLLLTSNEEAERVYNVLRDSGEVFMPLEETFFAHRFAMLRDRYGINWMLLHERPCPDQQGGSDAK